MRVRCMDASAADCVLALALPPVLIILVVLIILAIKV